MPYISVTYPKSDRQYTFYTSQTNIQPKDVLLAKDKNGFSLVTAVGYVPKPSFPCNVVVMTVPEMNDKLSEEENERDLWSEDEEENGDIYA